MGNANSALWPCLLIFFTEPINAALGEVLVEGFDILDHLSFFAECQKGIHQAVELTAALDVVQIPRLFSFLFHEDQRFTRNDSRKKSR